MGETRMVSRIEELHAVHDAAKRDALITGMAEHGWTGRPLLAYDDGNGYHALTGSHRAAAAIALDIEIPVYLIDISAHVWTDEGACEACGGAGEDCWVTMMVDARDDDERLEAIERSGDQEAISLMQAEIEACDGKEAA